MKLNILALSAGLVAALPQTPPLAGRQLGSSCGGATCNELENGSGSCPKAIFIFARASTETGNMVGHILIDSQECEPSCRLANIC